MRAGRLDRRITIQRKASVSSPSGEPMESWSALVADLPAALSPVAGSEVQGNEHARALQQVEFEVRWMPDIEDLSPLDRIVYPSDAATDSPSMARTVYEIVAVNEIGRRRGLQIIAARRPDVSP